MEQAKIALSNVATEWIDRGMNDQQIRLELAGIGVDERDIPEMLREIKMLRNARNTTKGMYFILAGALMCLFSCIFTLMATQSNGIVLYGLTSLGLVVIFIGLYKIFS